MALEMVPIEGDRLEHLARRIFADPEAVRYTGWADEEDGAGKVVALWLERPKRGWRVFQVERDGIAVGLAGFTEPDPDDGLSTVATYLLERGSHVGRWVAVTLQEMAAAEGATGVRAITHRDNVGAHRSLESVGFRLVGPATCEWANDAEAEQWLEYRAISAAERPK